MTKIQLTPTNGVPPRGAYSAGIKCGNFVFVAGQSSRDTELRVIGTTIEDQTRRTIMNVESVLAVAGASLRDIVKSTVHLRNLHDFERYNKIYAGMIPEPWPTRTTVGSELAPGVLIEIDVVAYVNA